MLAVIHIVMRVADRPGDRRDEPHTAHGHALTIVLRPSPCPPPLALPLARPRARCLASASTSPQVLATLTQDIGKILQAISKASIGGASDLITSLNVASLALKHRENKNQRQRIVCFVGSPVAGAGAGPSKGIEDSLVKLGKKLKKNNVAVDVVVFGDEGVEVEEPLRKFVEAVGSADNS